jgi:hypothetical protein
LSIPAPAAETAAALSQLLERVLRDARRQSMEVSGGSAGDLSYCRILENLAALWAQPPPAA